MKLKNVSDECGVGKYRDNTVTVCTQCPENTYSSMSGTVTCTSCYLGSVSDNTRTKCGEYFRFPAQQNYRHHL